MLLLAADTSTSINTIALCRDDQVLAEVVVECGRGHSERLLSTVQWVLDEAGHTFQDVECLAIARGPGSFTGLRIGVSTFKGLAFSRDLPMVGVSTLSALARCAAPREGTVCALIDARMKEVFGAVYAMEGDRITPLTEELVLPVEEVVLQAPQSTLFLGDGARLYRERILACRPCARFAGSQIPAPRASAIAAEALVQLRSGADATAALVEPVYLRVSQAEQARQARAAAEQQQK